MYRKYHEDTMTVISKYTSKICSVFMQNRQLL